MAIILWQDLKTLGNKKMFPHIIVALNRALIRLLLPDPFTVTVAQVH